ncbi:MAG: hypothetical protein AAB512_00245 [Patescibacteria group bacterium]
MAKRAVIKKSKGTPISQALIALTLVVIVIAAIQAVTNQDYTTLAPTQLFLVAGVLGILGLYLKDEK